MTLRVGVDAWPFTIDRRGMGRYARAVVGEFAERFANDVACVLVVPERPAWRVVPRYRKALDGRRLPVVTREAVNRSRLDVLWFPFNGVAWDDFALPAVATLHDASTFVLPGYAEAWRTPFHRAAARCARIITDSRFSARELAIALDLASERIDVVPLGVAPPLPPAAPSLDVAELGRFVLFVGELEARKGLDVLADAAERLRADGVRVRVVAVGLVPDGARVPPGVTHLGRVDDATLAALYRGCAVFAYPSRYEGFGLPVLEAMSYGAPVVATDAAAIPEAGGDAALYVPSGDDAALADALRAVLADASLAAELRRRGAARASAMTWQATAAGTLAVLQRAAG